MDPPDGTLPALHKPLCTSFKIVSLDTSHAAKAVVVLSRIPSHNMNECSQSGPFPVGSHGLLRTLNQDRVSHERSCAGGMQSTEKGPGGEGEEGDTQTEPGHPFLAGPISLAPRTSKARRLAAF